MNINQLLDTPASAPDLPAADDALSSSPPPFSPMQAEAFAAEYLLPRPSGSPDVFTAPLSVIDRIFLAAPAPVTSSALTNTVLPLLQYPPESGDASSSAASPSRSPPPPAPTAPCIVPVAYPADSAARPPSAGSASQSPAWDAVAAPPAPATPSFFLSQPALYDLPDPSAAISAAAYLPTKSTRPHDVTLTSGLDSSASRSTFLDRIPEAKVFADSVSHASLLMSPEMFMKFLDGGDGRKGILTAFRRKRTEALKAQRPGRRGSSVSGSAYEDARYFARQVHISVADEVITYFDMSISNLPERQQQDIRYYREIMDAGGGRELMRRSERRAEKAGAVLYTSKLAAKTKEVLTVNEGLPLSPKQTKQVRDAASGARSNEVRKQTYNLMRAELMNMLFKRRELLIALPQTIADWPLFSSRREIAPSRSR